MKKSLNYFIPFVIGVSFIITVAIFIFSSIYFFQTFIYKSLSSNNFWVETDIELLRWEMLKLIIFQSLIAVILFLGIYIFLFFILEKNIFNPLSELRYIISRIQQGDDKAEFTIREENEIGELASGLNDMIKELRRSHDALQEAKTTLEIRVKARTREIEEVAKSLDQKVKERTSELQERLRELEKFHRLAVGRELKMVELKNEIKILKDKLKEYENRSKER
jgi:nitrate/nitrite-specific signal transduction histidine kinase